MRKPRHVGHKISLVLAFVFGALVLPTFGVFVWFWQTHGLGDTWTPSMLAAVAFLGCCAGVCYAISIPQPLLPTENPAVDR